MFGQGAQKEYVAPIAMAIPICDVTRGVKMEDVSVNATNA